MKATYHETKGYNARIASQQLVMRARKGLGSGKRVGCWWHIALIVNTVFLFVLFVACGCQFCGRLSVYMMIFLRGHAYQPIGLTTVRFATRGLQIEEERISPTSRSNRQTIGIVS